MIKGEPGRMEVDVPKTKQCSRSQKMEGRKHLIKIKIPRIKETFGKKKKKEDSSDSGILTRANKEKSTLQHNEAKSQNKDKKYTLQAF